MSEPSLETSPDSAAAAAPTNGQAAAALTPSTRPLFRVDPGWPFVLAGLALLVAGILIPAQRELHELRGQQAVVEAHEARVYARLEAYDRFLLDLRANEPDLVRRLAIAHLNMVPKGEQSLLLTPGLDQTVAQWIDESVPPVAIQPEAYPDTLLGRLAVGPNRLWLLAASVFLLFVGMLLGPDTVRPLPPAARRDEEGDGDAEASDASQAGATTAVAEPLHDQANDQASDQAGHQAGSSGAGGRMASLGARPLVDGDVIDVEVVEAGAVEELDDVDAEESVDAAADDGTDADDADEDDDSGDAADGDDEGEPEAEASSDASVDPDEKRRG